MRNYLLLLFKMFLFWWIIFLINRVVFILFFSGKFSGIPLSETLASFSNGFRLDLSAVCYVLIIPVVFLIVQQFTANLFYRRFLLVYTIVLLLITSFVCVFDLAIYSDWGTKLSYRAIHYLKYANEGAAFTKFSDDVILFLVMMVQVGIGLFLFRKFFPKKLFYFTSTSSTRLQHLVLHLLLFGFLFLGIRGGWQQIPVNESSAYFSRYQVVNDAAVNTVWNAGKKISQDNQSLYKNPYQFFSNEEAKKTVNALYHTQRDSVISVLTTSRPNVVLFLLESFTADVVAALGGEKGIAANLDTLIQNGLLFTNIYSQGFRTDQGLADVLSGFPAQPNFSVIMQPEKFKQLKFLPRVMAENGYHNSFFYGGETAFANMKAYLLEAGIEKITDKSSFSAGEMNAKWGAHDGFVFQKQAQEIRSESQPFFSVILSLSSHEPFTVPMKTKFPGDDTPSKFKNSCAYTDKSIREYFESVRNEPWYRNTLFILVADHGHLQPRNRSPREPARFHIPLIFYGEVIKPEFRGVKMLNLGMQSDIPATLLSQLNITYQEFAWSNNLLNPYRNNFAYYTSDDAFGWITDNGSMLYDFKTNDIAASTITATEEHNGKAFLQTLFEEYINY